MYDLVLILYSICQLAGINEGTGLAEVSPKDVLKDVILAHSVRLLMSVMLGINCFILHSVLF